MLILKATSQAALLSLEQALSILQDFREINQGVPICHCTRREQNVLRPVLLPRSTGDHPNGHSHHESPSHLQVRLRVAHLPEEEPVFLLFRHQEVQLGKFEGEDLTTTKYHIHTPLKRVLSSQQGATSSKAQQQPGGSISNSTLSLPTEALRAAASSQQSVSQTSGEGETNAKS